jgi:hypothetical protein
MALIINEIRSFSVGRLARHEAFTKLISFSSWIAWLVISTAIAHAQTTSAHLLGDVLDENGSPVSDVRIVIESSHGNTQTTYTDVTGHFNFAQIDSKQYQLIADKPGFFRISKSLTLTSGENEILLTINHETEITEKVEVISTAQEINPQNTSHEESLVAREITDIPVPSTHDLKSSLPALPEVISDKANQIHVAGGRENETQFILDGFDIGDPATGSLTARVNVDSVRLVETESGHYSSQYGNGGTSVLSLETNVGDDRWRQSLTNFIPAANTQSGLRLGNWYPRYTISGPLSKERAWFSEAISIQRNIRVFSELPQNADTITQWSGDNLIRVQVNLTPTNFLQGGFL